VRFHKDLPRDSIESFANVRIPVFSALNSKLKTENLKSPKPFLYRQRVVSSRTLALPQRKTTTFTYLKATSLPTSSNKGNSNRRFFLKNHGRSGCPQPAADEADRSHPLAHRLVTPDATYKLHAPHSTFNTIYSQHPLRLIPFDELPAPWLINPCDQGI